ncbi:hypothetical protein BBJ28_00016050 [Nothophytophthora sp. Chile5]|nr:hypothetical protein BBJ28_00016050 [Nothophytophthora sp. Chile5]
MFQSAVIRDEYEFTGHNSALGAVCYNRHQDSFVSVDESCLRLWRASGSRPGGQLRHVNLPARTSQFIRAIAYIDTRQLYVASALDGTLRLYDQSLNELAALFTGRGTILSMVFDRKHNRLLTGGIDGCAAWQVKPRPSGVPEGALNPQYEFTPLTKFFSSTPATSASSSSSSRKSGKPGAKPSKASKTSDARSVWVESVQLSPDSTRLYAQSSHWIDVFNPADGTHLERCNDLFPAEHGTLTAFVAQERAKYLVCGTSSGAIVVLSRHPISIVHVFKDHTQAITSLAEHATSRLVISSSLDGSVRMWDLEARRQAHRLSVGQAVCALQLVPAASAPQVAGSTQLPVETEVACRFYCRLRSTVKLFRIQSIIKEHQPCLAPISILQRVIFPTTRGQRDQRQHGGGFARLTQDRQQDDTVDEDGEDSADSDGDADDADEDEEQAMTTRTRQLIVAAGTDKTLRIFAGRAANEAPSFSWIPEEQALELVGFALHPVSRHLFLLLGSQKLLVVDTAPRHHDRNAGDETEADAKADATEESDAREGTDATTSCIERVVDLGTSTSVQKVASQAAAVTDQSGIKARGAARGDIRNADAAAYAEETLGGSVSSARGTSSGLGGGALRCICVCPFPPVFHAPPPSSGASSPQARRFNRSFVSHRHSSSVGQKEVQSPRALAAAGSAIGGHRKQSQIGAGQLPMGSPRRRNALVSSEWEWVVCGSELGHLLFWHTGLRGGREAALSLEAHDASIVALSASASSPLVVSLDAAGRVHLWSLQPVFALRNVLELGSAPTTFVLSPTSEMLLSGFDDGRVILHAVCDEAADVETFSGGDDHHSTTVSAGDFLDEHALVLTASVDAVVKVWDQQRTLLRQVTLVTALSSLCFLNADGDLLAGLSTGTFVISRRDVLPDKLPKPTSRRRNRQERWTAGALGVEQQANASPKTPAAAKLTASEPKTPTNADAGLGIATRQTGKSDVAASISRRAPDSAAQQLLAHVIRRPVEAASQLQPPLLRALSSTSRRPRSRHGRSSNNNSVDDQVRPRHHLLSTTSTARACGLTLACSIQTGLLAPIASTPLKAGEQEEQQEEDWRDEIMCVSGLPASPFQKLMRAPQRGSTYRRKKAQIPSSPLVLQALGPNPRASHSRGGSSRGGGNGTPGGEERHLSAESPSTASPTTRLGLGVGNMESPVLYCKHQAPVPPKDKTPRKLWNAIGGEDRRLIVLQRNHLPPC